MPLTSPRDFGRDHWKLLMYIEHCIVDNNGVIKKQKMRCNPGRHPEMSHKHLWSKSCNTVIRDGKTLDLHDDWDCLEDLHATGWVATGGDEWPDSSCERGYTWLGQYEVRLSRSGWLIAHMLRRHVGEGGTCADFDFTTSIVRALLETSNGP